jgi:uncharacterized protein YllA (UPF0747 family)
MRHGPSASGLFMDYLDSWTKVQAFYAHDYSIDTIRRVSKERKPIPAGHREKLCEVLHRQQRTWGTSSRGVEKLASGAVAIVTAQQPVLFSGSHLSILKAITVIRIARELEASGISAVPVFWVASEDHDYEELESAWVLDRDSALFRAQVDLSNNESRPSGWSEFRSDVVQVTNACLSCLPQSEYLPATAELLQTCYVPGASPVLAFGRMIARLFEGTELTLLDPLDPVLKELAAPVIDVAIRGNAGFRSALIARGRDLSAAGYHEQVRVDDNFTGLFAYEGRSRIPVKPPDVRAGIAWSPNVLLRPVVQDTLLPTAAYIAGPAEIAYFAQAGAAYEFLNVPMPPVVPRISATIVEPRISRAADKYGITLLDAFKGRDSLRRKAVDALQDGESFERLRTVVETELESLRPLLGSVDPTLLGALETSRQKVLHQIETLRSRYVNAAARRSEVIERHIDAIANSWFPDKKLQERVISIVSFLARYGQAIVPQLTERSSLDTREHQIIEI